eukprot:9492499-Pyramimonas_sp.AAC.1
MDRRRTFEGSPRLFDGSPRWTARVMGSLGSLSRYGLAFLPSSRAVARIRHRAWWEAWWSSEGGVIARPTHDADLGMWCSSLTGEKP